MQHKSAGFTLIELMIVAAIIGILTMVILPTYKSYIERARFVEIITQASIYKTAITLALQQGALLADLHNNVYGIPEPPLPSKNLASLIVKSGSIIATATKLVSSATYILKPNADGSRFSVSGTCLQLGYCHD